MFDHLTCDFISSSLFLQFKQVQQMGLTEMFSWWCVYLTRLFFPVRSRKKTKHSKASKASSKGGSKKHTPPRKQKAAHSSPADLDELVRTHPMAHGSKDFGLVTPTHWCKPASMQIIWPLPNTMVCFWFAAGASELKDRCASAGPGAGEERGDPAETGQIPLQLAVQVRLMHYLTGMQLNICEAGKCLLKVF